MPKRNLERGGIYPTHGYDVIAAIMVTEGGGAPWRQHVVILNNNSTHFLLFWKERLEDNQGVFIKDFQYGADGEDWKNDNSIYVKPEDAYHAALNLAVELVKEN